MYGGGLTVQCQLMDHLSSAKLELDGEGAVRTDKDHSPFDSTIAKSSASGTKELDYAGKEKDPFTD